MELFWTYKVQSKVVNKYIIFELKAESRRNRGNIVSFDGLNYDNTCDNLLIRVSFSH